MQLRSDVDALAGDVSKNVVIGGLMEHIEPAGTLVIQHVAFLLTLSPESIKTIKRWTKTLAIELDVVGLINLQFAVKRDDGNGVVFYY